MDSAFAQWLLERLVMYKEVCIIELNTYKFEINGKELTREQCIDRMIELCKKYGLSDYDSPERNKTWEELTEIWKVCGRHIGW